MLQLTPMSKQIGPTDPRQFWQHRAEGHDHQTMVYHHLDFSIVPKGNARIVGHVALRVSQLDDDPKPAPA